MEFEHVNYCNLRIQLPTKNGTVLFFGCLLLFLSSNLKPHVLISLTLIQAVLFLRYAYFLAIFSLVFL